jgi:glucan biosynthesis protein C
MEDRATTRATTRATARVYYVDWLRILAVLLLFPFHVLRVFNNEDFYVKGAHSEGLNVALGVISVWHMPLLFLLAGASTYYALQKRSAGTYAWERVGRLLVPLAFGIFILVPPQTWFGARFNSGYTGSYWHYLASGDFLQWNIQGGGDYYGGFGVGQLWFILWLFVIALVVLPLLAWGARGRGVSKMQAFSRLLARPVAWPVALVILWIGEIVPEVAGKATALFLFVFVLGFVAVCDPAFARSARRYYLPAIVAGLACIAVMYVTRDHRASLPDPSVGRGAYSMLDATALWLMLVGLFGAGVRWLDRTSAAQRYLAEGSYPLYILHQTVIVILAFFVVDFAIPAPAQAVVLFVLVVAGTFALYEIVRRVRVFRFLFGMKRRKKKPRVAEGAVVEGEPAVVPVATERGPAASPEDGGQSGG